MTWRERAEHLAQRNVLEHRWQVEALARLGDREEALLRSFFTAINLYPPLLLRYAGEGISAALVLGREDAAIDVLKKCILLFARTSDVNGQPLEISDDTKSTVRGHRGRLTGWIRELADKLVVEGRL